METEASVGAEAHAPRPPLNVGNVLFFGTLALMTLAWPVHASVRGIGDMEIGLTLIYVVGTSLAISVGYHRLVTHRAFECHPALKTILLLAAGAAAQGSALKWATDHLYHHAHVDTDLDPHSPVRGFWHAQFGWILRRHRPAPPHPTFLTRDPLLRWQHDSYLPCMLLFGFGVPWLLGGLGALLLAGAARTLLVLALTGLVNSWGHLGKDRRFDPRASACDSTALAFLTFGEGWQSYHHRCPRDYRLGPLWYQWDPGKWVIELLFLTRLARIPSPRSLPTPEWVGESAPGGQP